jgi:effector-binding domain-containing protein
MLRSAPLAVALAALTPAQEAEPKPALPPAAELLDAAETKVGDPGRRAALKSLLAKGTIAAAGIGEGAFQEAYLGADRAQYTTRLASFGAMTMGCDPQMSWSTDPAMGISVRRGDEEAGLRRMFAIGRRAPWRTLYAAAETVAATDRGYRIRMTPARGKPDHWLVDAASGLVTRVELALPDPAGGEIACQFLFADWKRVDGLLYPHRKTQEVGTYEIVYTYSSIAPNAPLTEAEVAPSEQVLAAATDPDKQTPRAPAKAGDYAIETLARTHTAAIRVEAKIAEIGKTLAVLLPEVMAQVMKAGVSPSGPPFSLYHSIRDGVVDLEAGMPVARPIEAAGRVKPSELPAGKVAVGWHIGPYEKLAQSHAALEKWVGAQGLRARGGCWEVYWTDPGIEPDSSKWRTQLLWPVSDKDR